MVSRRRFIQASSIGAVTTVAGCTSLTGGGGGNNNNGSGGSGSPKVNLTMSPEGFQGIVMDHIHNETNILKNRLKEAGYQPNVQRTWKGKTLFAAGGPDFSTIGSLECATLGPEREIPLAVNAKMAPQWTGMLVKAGSKYDPANTGSAQATFDMVVDENANVGLGGWAQGHLPADRIVVKENYGYDLSEDGDFKIQMTDLFAIPKLLMEEKIAIGPGAPILGAAPMMMKNPPELKPLYWIANELNNMGYGAANLNCWTTTQKFAKENPKAVKAVVQSWREGMKWFFENPVGLAKSHAEMIGAKNKAQARYMAKWGILNEYDMNTSMLYKDIQVDDQFIKSDKDFLSRVAELGLVPDDWSDWLNYRQVPQE